IPAQITDFRALDLDHLGAVVGEHLRAAGTHVDLGEVEDDDSVEGADHRTVSLWWSGQWSAGATLPSSIVALADGWSPGSAPWSRILVWISLVGTSRTVSPLSTASAAAMPTACPCAMQGGISRDIRC